MKLLPSMAGADLGFREGGWKVYNIYSKSQVVLDVSIPFIFVQNSTE